MFHKADSQNSKGDDKYEIENWSPFTRGNNNNNKTNDFIDLINTFHIQKIIVYQEK